MILEYSATASGSSAGTISSSPSFLRQAPGASRVITNRLALAGFGPLTDIVNEAD